MTKAKFKSFWDKFGTLTILIFLMACLSIASPRYFLTLDNFKQ
ncbi:allose ABC transporter, partial [Ruminococcus sp. AF14-10]